MPGVNLPCPEPVPATAQELWSIPVAWMKRHGDRLVAVEHDHILGVFHIAGVHREAAS